MARTRNSGHSGDSAARAYGTIGRSGASKRAEKSVNHQPATDGELVEAALAGDRDAFGDLVVRYQDRLFNTLVRILGSREDAADAAQDAFVQAYAKLESFRGASQFYTWLYRIAMNVALSRRRRRRPVASVDAAKESLGEEPVDAADGPEADALSRERAEQVQAALGHLGDQQRKILVLREMEGFSYESIADILELPVGTVRSRLFRARLQLRERLRSMWGEEAGQPG
jgi:RNA polymerase sigma-70 factor (ECF subfamily)